MNILETVAAARRPRPESISQIAALNIASRLHDMDNVYWYLHIADRYSPQQLIAAAVSSSKTKDSSKSWMMALLAALEHADVAPFSTAFAAICISRRYASISLYQGTRLVGIMSRSLRNSFADAETSLLELVNRFCATYRPHICGIESGGESSERIDKLRTIATESFRQALVPLLQIDHRSCYSLLGCKQRRTTRRAALTIWPSLSECSGNHSAVDSVVLGMATVIESLWNIKQQDQ